MTKQTCGDIEFVRLLTSHQRSLHRYIVIFLPRAADAEDVLQETNAVLWTKARQFQPGTSFLAWAKAIARFEIIEFCRRNGQHRAIFDTDLMDTLSAELVNDDSENRRADAMQSCVEKLPPHDRSLIDDRYHRGRMVKEIARLRNRPANSIYRSLERIRMALLECIDRTLASEDRG
jgi:RNA polymerase sigma-70 factor (ECF subfamily)